MKCPGQDMQFWENDAIFDIDCPKCGKPVEFYKDDTTRKCANCNHRFVNPRMDFGCAAYCKFAEQCLGTLPEEFIGSQDNLLKDKVAVEIKRYYKTDFKKISKVARVARYAEKIGKAEGANMPVLLCAAYLNTVGYNRKNLKSTAGESEEKNLQHTGIASDILKKLGAKDEIVEEVCLLIDLFNSTEADSCKECKVLKDAYRIVELEDKNKKEILSKNDISACYLTNAGKQLAEELIGPRGSDG